VERDSDNLATNVILDDSASLTLNSLVSSGGTLGNWVGANSGFIKGWYDQSGNTNHAWQTTSVNQPRLINGGVLHLLNGKASMTFDGIDYIDMPSGIYSAANSVNKYISIVSRTTQDTVRNRPFYIGLGTGTRYSIWFDSVSGRIDYTGNGFANSVNITGITKTNQLLITGQDVGGNQSIYVNGNAGGTNTLGGVTSDSSGAFIGSAGSTAQRLEGDIQELIMYSLDQSSNRIGIETNINNFYLSFLTSAEVDQFLIDADNGGAYTNGMTIDLSNDQPRTSASDGAVSNLTTLGVTIITA